MALIAQKLGIELLHVPYKGSADLMQSIFGGNIMAAADSTGFAPQVEAGKLRVLNTWGAERLAKFPDAPTLVESGFTDVVVIGWTGLVAPAGTPVDIVNKVSLEVGRVLASAEVRSALAVTGRDLTPSSPEAFGALIRAEIEKWSKVIRAVGLENSQ